MMKNDQYNYFAFVSYSHSDKKYAQMLQRGLEAYRLPTALCKKHSHIPRKIQPVFRDETDLAGSRVQRSLDKELNDSRFLIVICSPHSAKSNYVNKEVEHFISQGREDHIIPYIIEGVPFSGGEQECFPPALRSIQPEILGYDLKELGSRNAMLKIIATMLNIRPDELIRRDKRRRSLIVGTVIASAFAILLAFIMLLLQWNSDVSEQLMITQQNESEVLALLSEESLREGDRYHAIELALQGLPNSENDRAYSYQAIHALSQSLYLYQNEEYCYDGILRHGAQITKITVSQSGKYVFVADTGGYYSLYDTQSSELVWTFAFDIYYDIIPEYVYILESENIVLVDNNGFHCYDLETGEELSNEIVDHAPLQFYKDGKSIALHQYTYERIDYKTVEHRNWFVFCDAAGNIVSKTEQLPVPTYISEVNASSFSDDGLYYTAAFCGRQEKNMYFFIMDTASGSIKHQVVVPYKMLPSEPGDVDNSIEYPAMVFFGDFGLFYIYENYVISLDPVGSEIRSVVALPETVLAARLRNGNSVEVVLKNGEILNYDCDPSGSLTDNPETVFSCGFQLYRAEYSAEELFVIKEDDTRSVMRVCSGHAGQEMQTEIDIPLKKDVQYQVYPLPDETGVLAFGQSASGEYHLLIYHLDTQELEYEFTFTWEDHKSTWEPITFVGFCSDPNKLLFNRCIFDLEEGIPMDFDLAGYDPDPVYGFDFNHSSSADPSVGCGVYTAVFNTEQDVLTYWQDGENRKTSKAPVDIVDSYYWMYPWNLTEIGANGLMLVRNYIGNAYRDVVKIDEEFDRDRPIGYGVFSAKDNEWRYWDNPCTEDGIPAIAIAQEKKWVASVDYDGFIRVYDWDTNTVLYQISTQILGQAVSCAQFAMDDSILLIMEDTGALTLVDIETASVLGEYQLSYGKQSELMICEDQTRNHLYVGNKGGSMTGLCIETTTWNVIHEISGLLCTLPQEGVIIQWDSRSNRVVSNQILSLEEMVNYAHSLFSLEN